MKKYSRLVALIITPVVIFATLCGGTVKAYALETTSTYMDDSHCPKGHCPRGPGLLKESVDELKESGALTEQDVKNIDSYMSKERQVKEAEIKEKIYNSECEKIDKMVSGKVITKAQGEKLKATVKENIDNMKKNMKKTDNN